ncbi:hypothetical protein RUND412_008887 [Rhizina undulata]
MDGSEEDQNFENVSDPEEQAAMMSTMSAYYLYRRAAHQNLTHRRRTSFYQLPRAHQELLSAPSISYLTILSKIDEAIESNAHLSESILRSASIAFGIDISSLDKATKQALDNAASNEDIDKVRSTLKQFYRDWSAEGAAEREKCYGPVMEALRERYGGLESGEREKVRVLVPGAGLGRLAFDIVREGFTTQGNEFSYHQLTASNYILNDVKQANQHTIHPFLSSFSNHKSRENHLRAVKIPDIHPASLLSSIAASPAASPPSSRFSMCAGEFASCYSNPSSAGSFEVCATVFFIDTASNVIEYLQTIHHLLVPGGVWINHGPLLWHWEDGAPKGDAEKKGSVELCLDEVLVLVERLGFRIVKRGSGERMGYVGDERSMVSWEYQPEFWVAVKV